MSNIESKNGGLKVVFKQDSESIIPLSDATSGNMHTDESLAEYFDRILKGFNRFIAALKHQFEHRTFGVFEKKYTMTFVKICILGIIMLFILKKDIALDVKMANFASDSELVKNNKEKTYTDKHKRDYATQASMGAIVNDLAPASPGELRESQVRSYIDRFSDIAVAEMDNYGIPASISMAQAIVESRSGLSRLAVSNNNHFGIKCFSKTCPKGHCSNFTDDHHKDFFRKYAGSVDSWREHSKFLMKNSYRKLLKYGKDYRVWARGLRELGYATDPTYDKKLIAIIEKYELHRLDDL